MVAWCRRGHPLAPLERALAEHALNADFARPIVAAHAIKTTWAAFDEARALEADPLTARFRSLPIAGLVRLFASPLRGRSLARTAHEAQRFVAHGEIPRVLAR